MYAFKVNKIYIMMFSLRFLKAVKPNIPRSGGACFTILNGKFLALLISFCLLGL